MRKKVAFHNLGCKVNSYEMEYVQQRFTENDFRVVPFDQKADIYVVNTCTVTNIADRKSRQMLHKAKALNPDAIVVAMGCFAETGYSQALNDESIDIIIGNNDKGHAYEIICEALTRNTKRVKDDAADSALTIDESDKTECVSSVRENTGHIDIASVREYDEFRLSFTSEHTRVHIKIQDGCNQFCSYCAIPLARGRVRSRNIDDIVSEVTGLTERGYKEFVLTGIHLSSYGMENYNMDVAYTDYSNARLIDAIEAVCMIDGVKRVRLGSLEPRIITDEFLQRLVNTGKICPHFHLSLQSGADSVLKRMNRRYTTDEFYEKAMLIRDYFEHPGITTDVIAGFPGETDEEFNLTREYMEMTDFYEAHIFKYSRRKGTAADTMPGQLTDKEKSARSSILIKDAAKRSKAFREYYIGKKVEVLFEEAVTIDNAEYITGYTREYVKVAVPVSSPAPGELPAGVQAASAVTPDNITKYINNIYTCTVTGFITDEIMSADTTEGINYNVDNR